MTTRPPAVRAAPGHLFRLTRRWARRPGVRRIVEPLAAWTYAARTRQLDAEAKWRRGASWEIAHWDGAWLADARARGLLDARHPLEDRLVCEAIDRVHPAVDPVGILDVGAGPVTPLGKVHPRRRIAITASDALAHEYDAVLARAGVDPPVRTVFAEGERLVQTFGTEGFDIVHCGNALDHHHDPIVAVEQMLAVARPAGLVLLNHYVDEGISQRYLGMHQWNITVRADHLVIWNRAHVHDVTELLRDRAEVTCLIAVDGSARPRVQALIAKRW